MRLRKEMGNGDFFSYMHTVMQAERKRKKYRTDIRQRHENIYIFGQCQLSERVVVVTLKGKPYNISIIAVYAAKAQNTDEIESYKDITPSLNAKRKKLQLSWETCMPNWTRREMLKYLANPDNELVMGGGKWAQ